MVRHVLDRLGLELNEAKTQIVDATEARFNFLGFSIRLSRGRQSGKSYPHVCPSDKSLKKIKAKLTALTGRELTPHCAGQDGGKRESQPSWLGKLLSLSELKPDHGKGKDPCGTAHAQALDVAS